MNNDKEASIAIPEGAQPGEIIRVKGWGMPSLRRGRGVGELFVQIVVKIPTKLSKRQRELLVEFSELEENKGRGKNKNFWGKITGI